MSPNEKKQCKYDLRQKKERIRTFNYDLSLKSEGNARYSLSPRIDLRLKKVSPRLFIVGDDLQVIR